MFQGLFWSAQMVVSGIVGCICSIFMGINGASLSSLSGDIFVGCL